MHNCPTQYFTPRSLKTIVLMALLVISQPLFAFTFDVDSPVDAVDDNPGDGVCHTAANTCTLRAAIQEANAWPGPDVIRLPANVYTLTITGADEEKAATGDLDISDDLSITGADKTTTIIDGNNSDRVFDIVSADINVTISNVTVQNGQLASSSETGAGINNRGLLTINDSVINQNKFSTVSGGGGGGIASVQGALIVNHTAITNNTASGFAGVQLNLGSMTISDSLIKSNGSQGSGGGVGIFNGNATIINTTISSNTGGNPGGQGGGINNGGHLTLVGSTIDNNTVAQGGGIVIIGTGTLIAVNSTITKNTAQAGTGGGILDLSGGSNSAGSEPTAILINTTIANNSAQGTENNQSGSFGLHNGYGGGLFYAGAKVSLNNAIIAKNSASTQGDDCSTGPSAFYAPGILVSLGYNIDSSNTCQLSGPGDLPNQTLPLATSLTDNGGPTQTLTMSSGPAIDAGDPLGCKDQDGNTLSTDQRSFHRPDGSACDIGAVELQQSTPNAVDLSAHVTVSSSPVDPGVNNLAYTVTVKNNGPNDASGVMLTDTLPPITSLSSYSTTPSGITCGGTGTNSASCNIGSLTVGSEVVITLVVNVPANATGTLTNTAEVTGSEPDANANNNTESTNTEVNLTADLQVTMTDSPDPAVLNQDQVTYTMTVTSMPGSQAVPNVTLVDTLPGSAILVANSTSTDRGTCTENGGAGIVTCNLGTMSATDAAHITLTVKPGVKGPMTNTANVNFDGTDLNPLDNKVSEDTTVAVVADVSVTATDDRDPVGVKNDLSYIINAKNDGPSPSSDVTLTATLPSGVNFSSASASQGLPCTESSGVVTCDLQGMAKDAQATVTIFVVPQNVATIQMTAVAQVASDETDPDSSNNSATETTQVLDNPATHSADLSIGLSDDAPPGGVNAGDTLTYTLTVQNNGPESASGVIAVLSLPASVSVSSPGSGCVKDNQTNIVRCALSDLNSGDSAQATVGVTPSQSGIIKAAASASFIGSDPDTTNNTATIATTVIAASSSTSSGGGGGELDPVTLMALLVLWAGGARLARRRGSAAK